MRRESAAAFRALTDRTRYQLVIPFFFEGLTDEEERVLQRVKSIASTPGACEVSRTS